MIYVMNFMCILYAITEILSYPKFLTRYGHKTDKKHVHSS